jgi:hypothetical protein
MPDAACCGVVRISGHGCNFPGRSISLNCTCADNGRLIFFKVMMPLKNLESRRRNFKKPWCKQMVQERFSPRKMAIISPSSVFDNPSSEPPPRHSKETGRKESTGSYQIFINCENSVVSVGGIGAGLGARRPYRYPRSPHQPFYFL